MTAYIIRNLDTGAIEPSSSRREGVWKSRATALQRIKGHWKPANLWRKYEDAPWLERRQLINKDLADFRETNPFDSWWPKHYQIICLSERSER